MSEYRHFIAYIYEYEEGKKTKNAGFVKVHMRNGICRMQLKLQSSEKELAECQICGFFHEGEWLYGITMGNLKMRGGSCEGNVVTAESVFQEQGYTFAQISGLWIQGKNVENLPERTFLTIWDERPVDRHRLTMERPEDVRFGVEAQNLQPGQMDRCCLASRWEQFQLHYPHTKPFSDEEIYGRKRAILCHLSGCETEIYEVSASAAGQA